MNLSPARLVGVLLALAPSVSGQEVAARAAAPSERVYFPADYRGEVFIDVGRILECDMWDGLAPGWRGLALRAGARAGARCPVGSGWRAGARRNNQGFNLARPCILTYRGGLQILH